MVTNTGIYEIVNILKGENHKGSRPVLCLDLDTRFPNIKNAIEWLKRNGHPKATDSAISMVCGGHRGSAYGFRWVYSRTVIDSK